MNYWIFQGNPDHFDVDTYISSQEIINWTVRQRSIDISIGDIVFIWRASGKKKFVPGVVAVAEIIQEPKLMPDDLSSHLLWHTGDPNKEELRVNLRIIKKCIKPKEVVKKDWLLDDPILQDLNILKASQGTNFLITPDQGQRLFSLSQNTGRDWTYDECVAGYGDEFNPSDEEDARKRTVASIVRRRGQPAFRQALINAYEGKCAITGCNISDALEAAHITPYLGVQTNAIQNGLLLRADLHTLFDLGKIAISSDNFSIVLHRDLRNGHYGILHGKMISVPKNKSAWPSKSALEKHKKDSGL